MRFLISFSHLCFKYKALPSFTNSRYLVITAALSCVQSPDKCSYTRPRLLVPAATSSLKLWLTVICRFSKHVCYSADLASGQRKPLKKQISPIIHCVWNTSPIWVCMNLMKHEIGSTLEELQHPPIDQRGIPSGPLEVFGHIRYIITELLLDRSGWIKLPRSWGRSLRAIRWQFFSWWTTALKLVTIL